jgi:hypothetical protein
VAGQRAVRVAIFPRARLARWFHLVLGTRLFSDCRRAVRKVFALPFAVIAVSIFDGSK